MGVYFGGPYTDYSAIQGPCAEGFHIPTGDERKAVADMGISLGLLDSSYFSSNDNIIYYLHLPLNGTRPPNNPSSISFRNSSGYYFSCVKAINTTYYVLYLNIQKATDGHYFEVTEQSRGRGMNIRPFSDAIVVPDSSWTVEYQGTGASGIYHNSTLGLISISSDGTNRITIADKNLGATTVWNNGDTLSDNNGGYFYQWGNNYGFPRASDASITTSSTKPNASTYGPGNYYSSSTRITPDPSYSDRSSVQNDNLRGGVTGVVQGVKELQNAYIGGVQQPGIYRNQTDGLISLSSDGTNWITIADKNLGATTVYNSGDTLSESNSGKYYQRGNNYGFAFSGTVSTYSSRINANGYGPGNYYSSSSFITADSWESGQNRNLRGGETGTNAAMQGPCNEGFHVPARTEWTSIYTVYTGLGLSGGDNRKSYLKLPLNGYRMYHNAVVGEQGTYGGYWAAQKYDTGSAYLMTFSSGGVTPQDSQNISMGFSLRPFKNEAVQPDGTRTVLYQ